MLKSSPRKEQRKSSDKLKKQLWKIFSEYVRRKDADFRGFAQCITCGKRYVWNSGMIHAGHWIHDKLDFDERNVHPQCRNCNYKYNKNVNTAYAVYMAKTYGVEVMEFLRKESVRKGNNYTIIELEKLILHYKELLKTL